jgi:peroxiredoxin
MTRTIQALSVAAFAVAFALVASAAETPSVGGTAPDFSLVDEDGKAHKLSDYKGKMVVLEWTNPECPYVQRHYRADTMEALSKQFEADVVWLAVNSTRDNTPEDTKSWKSEQGFQYATLQDPEGDVGHLYGAKTTPDMFVIDGEGVLRYAGAIDDDPRGKVDAPKNYVGQAIQAVLASNDPDPTQTRPYGCSVKYK